MRGTNLIKDIFIKFQRDDIFTRSSSLAYYSSLATAPLIILAFTFLGFIDIEIQKTLINEANSLIGPTAGNLLETIIEKSAENSVLMKASNIISISFLLISASMIFIEIQSTLNIIFGAKNSEPQKNNLISSLKEIFLQRLFSIVMVIVFIFIVTISLFISSSLNFILGDSSTWFTTLAKYFVDFIIFCIQFSIIIKVLPDADISIKKSLYAGAIISILFILGKELISIYIRNIATLSSYGAAGSLAVLLVWLHYSSIIFFTGAELAQQFIIEKK